MQKNAKIICLLFLYLQNLTILLFSGKLVYTYLQLAPVGDGRFLLFFPQLKVLDISHSSADDWCMATIGSRCPQLKYIS